MYYLIRESLTPCEPEDIASGGAQYVAVLTPEEWQQCGEGFDMLIDLAQELEENENGFFRDENLRYFHMFTERVIRLQDTVTGQREYVTQLRDLIQSHLAERQNRIMTVLTVITSIFLPLTLIAGWYGMNFRYMPELDWRWSYPAVLAVSVLIVVFCLILFRKKKWM